MCALLLAEIVLLFVVVLCCARACVRVTERTTKAKHRHDRTRGTTHDANGDEIHHGTGDVLLMVTVGDPGWAGCTMRSHRCGPRFRPLLLLLLLHLLHHLLLLRLRSTFHSLTPLSVSFLDVPCLCRTITHVDVDKPYRGVK